VTAQLLDGNALAKEIKARLKEEIAAYTQEFLQPPTLAVLRVGSDESVAGYARAIEKNCKSVGVAFRAVELGDDADQESVVAALRGLNEDAAVHGIMILEPLPKQIDHEALVEMLNPAKDVDGVHPLNAGRLAQQKTPVFVPATPAGGMRLLENAGVEFKGKHAVMVGRSDIVGKPMALLLLHRHCTVTIAHSRTQDLPGVCRSADILCVGIGRAEMVKADWVKPGAIVVDFGTTYTDEGLKGDCDQAGVAEVAGQLTPVPGGTGPMTNAVLMSNVLQAARMAASAQYGF
jgi:methylenetetrahydrofolate dehydrogenase (NADP+) / methenyltetrahydrofolate cyclohydrolase